MVTGFCQTGKPKLKAVVGCTFAAAMGAIFLYGAIYFPDAPFHECKGGYCGTNGTLHTVGQYRDYQFLENTFLLVFAVGVIVGAAVVTLEESKGPKRPPTP
jgi:hypothetical protein